MTLVRNMNQNRLNWNKYTWEEFEDICYEYVTRKYNASVYNVILTERRKDKGRDIIITNKITDKISWAECKHHQRSVGLDDIGKNVVLALTNQINKIIFFSVSRITPNTKHEILTAGRYYGFDVQFLDGYNLDVKIAEDRNLLNTYFKDSFNAFYPNNNTLCFDVCVDEFPNAYNDSFYNDLRYCRLSNGLEFYIHIFIKNNYSESDISDVEICIDESPDCHFFSCSSHIEFLKAQCDDLVTIKGILLNTQKVFHLPHLQIQYKVKNKKHYKTIEAGEIDGTECWFVPLCGNDYLNCISKTNLIAEKVLRGYTKILYIKGASGSGKSRLLKEISEKMFQRGFQTVYVNAMQNSNNLFFRELIRQLLYLPHLNSHNMFNLNEFELLLLNSGISFEQSKEIHSYLWYDQNTSPTLLGDFIIDCIRRKEKSPKLLVQIDNIQCLDKQIQQILLYICSTCSSMRTHLFFAFSLNTSVIKQSASNTFVNYLESEALHEEKDFVKLHQIQTLDNESKIHIAEHCLKLSCDIYKKELQEIAQKSGNLPLDVLLFSKNIFDSGCISYVNNNYIINNSELFSSKLNSLSDTFVSLIELRINAIDNRIISKEKTDKLFQIILFFENRVSVDLLQKFNIAIESVNELIKKLILCQLEDGYISFFHDNFFRYFSQKENYSIFTKKELKILLEYCKENSNDLNSSMNVNEAKCLYYLNKNSDFQVYSEKLLESLKSSYCYNEIIGLSDFYTKVITNPKYKNKRLLFSVEKAQAKLEITSFVEGIDEFRKIEKTIKESSTIFDVEIVSRFYHYYVNSYTHSGDYQNAIVVLQEFEKLQNISLQYRFLIEDRYCMCYFSIGNFSKANENIDKAIKTARKLNSDFWISTAYSDKAFNYFYNTNETSKIRYYFNKAIKYYDAANDQTPYRIIEIKIQAALSFILCNKLKKANQYIEEAIAYANERNYTYLLIPALNIKSYLLMLNKETEEAINVLKKALFYCEVFGSNKWMLIILNSMGVAFSLFGDIKKGYDYFSIAFNLMESIQNNINIISRFSPLAVNYLVAGYRINTNTLFREINNIQFNNIEFKNTICQELLKCEKNPFYLFNIKEYFPLTIKEYALMY